MIDVQEQQVEIITLLANTEREGIKELIAYLTKSDFFTAPASTRFHGCYPGGLAQHSLRVRELLSGYHVEFDFSKTTGWAGIITLPVTQENITVATLLHDLCKVGAYIGKGDGTYRWNRAQPKGHALLSLVRIVEHIELEKIEELMITYHMGLYGLREYDPKKGEYPITSDGTGTKEERYGKSLRNVWHHNPIVKFMYFVL